MKRRVGAKYTTMKRIVGKIIPLALVVCACFVGEAAARDVALISNKGSSIQALALEDVAKICTGKKGAAVSVARIYVSDLNQPGMKMIAEKVFGMTADELKASLAKMPNVSILPNDQAVLSAVERSADSAGFIDIYSITSAVRVVKVDGKLPLEPGYALHKAQ